MFIVVSLILALIVAGIAVGIMWSGMKSVAAQQRADDYLKKDSLKLSVNKDTFLYTRTEKTPKPQQNSPS